MKKKEGERGREGERERIRMRIRVRNANAKSCERALPVPVAVPVPVPVNGIDAAGTDKCESESVLGILVVDFDSRKNILRLIFWRNAEIPDF